MDGSLIVLALIGLALAVLIVLAAMRMARRRVGPPEEAAPLAGPVPKAAEEAKPEAPPEVKPAEMPQPEPEARPEPAKVLVVPVAPPRPIGAGLERTRREGFVARLKELFGGGAAIDEALISQAEEALLTADVGVKTASALIQAIRNEFRPESGAIGPQVLAFLQAKVVEMLAPLPHGMRALDDVEGRPAVIMVVGVNGTGKTTNIAKLANLYKKEGRKVLLAAGDTYRAAGADQLAVWGERIGVPVVVGQPNSDPASVIFDAAKRAKEEQADLLIADTAGRLHTNVNLVDELKKIYRVMGKAVPGAPHEVLLVLDATMGQNAVRQAAIFRQAVNVTGIALAKLDGTAKGGVVLSIAQDMQLPIRFVGIGEGIDDLRPFDPREFAAALFAQD